jgi:hypothetical protein
VLQGDPFASEVDKLLSTIKIDGNPIFDDMIQGY